MMLLILFWLLDNYIRLLQSLCEKCCQQDFKCNVSLASQLQLTDVKHSERLFLRSLYIPVLLFDIVRL